MQKLVIGVDIGGTSIKGASINLNGEVIDSFAFDCVKGEDGTTACKKLAKVISNFILEHGYDKKDILGIGIGCAGAINSKTGYVDYSNNLHWFNVPIVKIIEEETGLKVKITNDANAAALGEYKFGSGKNYNSLVLVTLGTGLGGGIIIDNKLFEGNEGKGAEIGHISFKQINGRKCTCGRRGCAEAYVSATGLIKTTKSIMKRYQNSLMWSLVNNDISKVNGKTCFDAAQKGDQAGQLVLDTYIEQLGEVLLSYMMIFRPDVILLSGGIANQKEKLTDPLNNYCKNKEYGFKTTPKVEIKTAKLGYLTGIIGAASLFID